MIALPFMHSIDDYERYLAGNHGNHPAFKAYNRLFTLISSLVSVNTLTCADESITVMMSTGSSVARLE